MTLRPLGTAGRRRLAAMAAAVITLSGLLVHGAVSASADVPATPSGWSQVWADDFNGPANSPPSSANWIVDTGHNYPGGPDNWGTGEIQNYTANSTNLGLDGSGNLRITPRRSSSGEWTSARIETRRSDFKPADGRILRIEGRIQMPNVTGAAAAGYWPAFWALGSPYRGNYWNWPGIGEFDIMENVNGLNSVWGVLHCGVAPAARATSSTASAPAAPAPARPASPPSTPTASSGTAASVPTNCAGTWTASCSTAVSQSRFDAATWTNMTGHAGYFLLLNVAMGGAFPNGVAGSATPTAATVPGHPMVVDYVAVWQSGTGNPDRRPRPDPEPGNVDARSTIQAESYQAQSGTVDGEHHRHRRRPERRRHRQRRLAPLRRRELRQPGRHAVQGQGGVRRGAAG